MAIQVINDPYRSFGGGLGASLGQGLGSGLSSGLEMLAKNKLQEVANRQKEAKFEQQAKEANLTSDEIALLKMFPDDASRFKVLQSLWQRKGAQPSTSQTGMEVLEGMPAQAMQTEQFNPLQQLEQMLSGATPQQFQQLMQGQAPMQQVSAPGEITPEGVGAAPQQPIQPSKPKSAIDLFRQPPPLSPDQQLRERLAREQMQLKRDIETERVERQERREAEKDTAKYVEDLHNAYDRARDEKSELNSLRALVKSGQARTGKTAQILKRLKLDDFLTNPTTDVANKIVNRLAVGTMSNLRTGTKGTNLILQAIQAQLPSLLNNPEGLDAIAKNMIINDDIKEEEYKTFNDLRKQSKGKLPKDIRFQVNEILAPRKDRAAKLSLANTLMVTGSLPTNANWSDDTRIRSNGIVWKPSEDKQYWEPVEEGAK
jgi:hypothetical protein